MTSNVLFPTSGIYQGYFYLAEGFRMIPETQIDALECYKTCYQLLGRNESWNIEMRRECYLHMVALGIMLGMCVLVLFIDDSVLVNTVYCSNPLTN